MNPLPLAEVVTPEGLHYARWLIDLWIDEQRRKKDLPSRSVDALEAVA